MSKAFEAYLSGIDDPKTLGRVRAALERPMRLNRGIPAPRYKHALRLFEEGWRVKYVRGEIRLCGTDGRFFAERDVTRALCDFVVFLTESGARFDPPRYGDGSGLDDGPRLPAG